MAAKKKKQKGHKSLQVAVEWDRGEEVGLTAITNMTVQGGEHETVISFYQTKPPLIMGTAEEKEAILKTVKSVKAVCIAKFVISTSRLDEFAGAFKTAAEGVKAIKSVSER